MIVKDEEDTIARCLDSIQEVVDEIVIVDTGSSDHTKEIVKKYTNKVFDFEWIDDFAAARNFSFSKATKDYILWLDADDVLPKEEKEKFLDLKKSLSKNIDVVLMLYHITFDKHGNPVISTNRKRLVKRERKFQWGGVVHEDLDVSGNILKSNIGIVHKKEKRITDRNLQIFERAIERGRQLTTREVIHYAGECLGHQKFEKAIELYNNITKEDQYGIEEKVYACSKLADCYVNVGKWDEAIDSCLLALKYDIPRAEICCRLGYFFLSAKMEYEKAIYWYKKALEVPVPTESPLVDRACHTWFPHLQLCICYCHVEDYEKAYEHNEKAAVFVPDNDLVQANREYVSKMLKEKEEI